MGYHSRKVTKLSQFMNEEIDVNFDEQDLADVNDFTPEELADDSIDWKEKAKTMTGIAKRKTTALKKAKEALTKKPPVVTPPQNDKKDEFGYDKKAYLNSLGFTDSEDHKYVQDIVKSSGKSLEDVLAMPFVGSELKRLGEERKTKAAAPPADGRSGTPARDTVEYWLAKGELPPADQTELRQKVVNAKIAKGKGSSNFSPNAVVGSA